MSTVICVDAIVLRKSNNSGEILSQDEVLLLHRKNTGFMDDTFCLPGGKPLENEQPKSALQRELQEELGITVELSAIEFAHMLYIVREPKNYLCLFFLINSWSGNIINKESEKHDYLVWSKLDNLPQTLMSGHKQALMALSSASKYSELTIET